MIAAVGEDGVVSSPGGSGVRLSELVATLSLVSDLGMGRPMERALRQTVIAMRLATAAGVADDIRAAAYYTSLITWVGCATDTSELAELFGDETEHAYADTNDENRIQHLSLLCSGYCSEQTGA